MDTPTPRCSGAFIAAQDPELHFHFDDGPGPMKPGVGVCLIEVGDPAFADELVNAYKAWHPAELLDVVVVPQAELTLAQVLLGRFEVKRAKSMTVHTSHVWGDIATQCENLALLAHDLEGPWEDSALPVMDEGDDGAPATPATSYSSDLAPNIATRGANPGSHTEINDNAWLTGRQAAEVLRVHPDRIEAFIAALMRRRPTLGEDGYHESPDVPMNQPRHFFRVGAIRGLALYYRVPRG